MKGQTRLEQRTVSAKRYNRNMGMEYLDNTGSHTTIFMITNWYNSQITIGDVVTLERDKSHYIKRIWVNGELIEEDYHKRWLALDNKWQQEFQRSLKENREAIPHHSLQE